MVRPSSVENYAWNLLIASCLFLASSQAADARSQNLTAAIQWNEAAVQAVRDAKMGAPMAARALAIVHTCMYDAWAAYDEHAIGTQLRGALRRPADERTETNKQRAISYAAYRALVDVLPVDTESVYKPLMRELGYDPNDNSTDIETPTGIGNVACAAVLEFRHHDKSNQLGDMNSSEWLVASGEQNQEERGSGRISAQDATGRALGPYGDWSGYRPVNPPGTVPAHFPFVKPLNPDRWQPLTYTDSTGNLVVQMFSGAQWCFVKPFALASGDEFRETLAPCKISLPPQGVGASVHPEPRRAPTLASRENGASAPEETSSPDCQSGLAKFGSPEYLQQAEELLALSANLTDRQKMIAEYWSDGPYTEQPPGHWMRFVQFVSERDHHSLDDDVKMFFALSNAMLDAGIAAWDAKRTYDSVRPITAISLLFNGKTIRAWGGPGKGTVEMDGADWRPYQLATFPTPPFPEYVSGHSTYSAAAARILTLWTASDHFGHSVTLPAGSSKIEPGLTPAQPITLKWETFTDAADQAGMSRRYGGIHFARADLAGRKLGRLVADRVWAKAQSYFDGTAPIDPKQLTAANSQ